MVPSLPGRIFFVALAAALALMPARDSAAEDSPTPYATVGPFEVRGDGRHWLDVGLGLFDYRNLGDARAGALRIEFRGGRKLGFVGPAAGFLANNHGFRYGYLGICAEITYKRFVLTPTFAGGYQHRGRSLDLGGRFQFRESLELSYRIDDRYRAGIAYSHVSNANLYDVNPGEDDVLLTIAAGF